MQDRIEADEHVRYVDVDVAGGYASTGRNLLTYDELSEGDTVRICAGVLEGCEGEVVTVDVGPPEVLPRIMPRKDGKGEPIYSYRCEKLRQPVVVAAEIVRTWSDGSVTHEDVCG